MPISAAVKTSISLSIFASQNNSPTLGIAALKETSTREERDHAFSNGGGRKAVEKPKAARKHDREESFEAPVGLEIETRGDDEASKFFKAVGTS